jgi:hypothetical protein
MYMDWYSSVMPLETPDFKTTRCMTCERCQAGGILEQFHKTQGHSWLAEELLASSRRTLLCGISEHHEMNSCRDYGLQSKIPRNQNFGTRWSRVTFCLGRMTSGNNKKVVTWRAGKKGGSFREQNHATCRTARHYSTTLFPLNLVYTV